jgi:molecular chaperone IbpA
MKSNDSYSYPPVNVIETENNTYLIQIALAGYRKENIKLSVSNGVLFLNVNESEQPAGKFLRKEIEIKDIKKSYNISGREIGKVSFENGLLTVELNVPEEKKPREITIY